MNARIYLALREAKLTTYQYEQSLLAQGNTDAAKIYTKRYEELKKLLEEINNPIEPHGCTGSATS